VLLKQEPTNQSKLKKMEVLPVTGCKR